MKSNSTTKKKKIKGA